MNVTAKKYTMPRVSQILLLVNLIMEGFSLICYVTGYYGPFVEMELTARTLAMVALLWGCFQNYKYLSSICRGYYYLATCVYITRTTTTVIGWVKMGNAFFQTSGNSMLLCAITLLYTAVYCYSTWQMLYNPTILASRKRRGSSLPPIPRNR